MTTRDRNVQAIQAGLAESLEQYLLERYGMMISGDDLRRVLGYLSGDAFRQAVARSTVPVPVFSLPNRRGKFALAKDIAVWMAEQRDRQVVIPDAEKREEPTMNT